MWPKVVVALLLIPSAILIEGVAVSYLWMWFISPLGVPVIGIVQGAGLAIFMQLITTHVAVSRNDTLTYNQILLANIMVSLWCWGIGFVINLWM